MSNTVRIKRRATGLAGAPASLQNAELAFNEVDDTLYYGKGTGGANGTATTVDAIGGKGAFVALSGDQTIANTKTFSVSPILPTPTAGDNSTKASTTAFVQSAITSATGAMLSLSVYDPRAIAADVFDRTNHTGNIAISTVTGLQANLDAKSPLASPTFTGTPAAPTATAGTNTTQLATTAFVQTSISNLIGAAPSALDTLAELANSLANNASFASTMTTSLAGKQPLDATLTALAGITTAAGVVPRFTGVDIVEAITVTDFAKTFLDDSTANNVLTTLGTGTMVFQNANNVAITGGTIDNVVIDCGTF